MSLAWIAQIVFYVTYFVAWLVGELPKTTWIGVSAICAIIVAVLLVIDNHEVVTPRHRRADDAQ